MTTATDLERALLEVLDEDDALSALQAVPDGWAKVDGRWHQIGAQLTPRTVYIGRPYDHYETDLIPGRCRVVILEPAAGGDDSPAEGTES